MKIVMRILFFLLIVLVLVGAFVLYTIRKPFPKMNGEIEVSGLKAAVHVYRDDFGVPHIYASNIHDLFLAQGYIHSQDRFWQMDFWRHTGSGRLSEMFGPNAVKTDKVLRTLGWARVCKEELEHADPVSLAILRNYAEGVNAYIGSRDAGELSLEYPLLKVQNKNYRIEPWEPLHSITWGKAMAWDLGDNMNAEIDRAVLRKTLSIDQLQQLYPPYPGDHPLILPGASAPIETIASAELFDTTLANLLPLKQLLGDKGDGIGSNNWVISGKLTATGKPILANDPHLGVQMPSIWYQMGLHCEPKTADCPYDVTGFSFAGVPGVIIGHNDRIAWGFTNVGPDVQDLFIEKLNPANNLQYEHNGQWEDMKVVTEKIEVAGGDPETINVRYTRHGPILSDNYRSMQGFSQTFGIQTPELSALALRWTALDPTDTFPAIWKMNIAHNWEEFRAAAREFDVPSQNMVYADVDGNIGYQVPGKIPIRAHGDGRYPSEGWTDEYDWTGYIPFEELPSSFNPEQGYIATANNAIVGSDYPHFITSDWDYGFRARRIVDLIEANKGKINVDTIASIQGDDLNLNAAGLVPLILKLPLKEQRYLNARKILEGWNFQQTMDSAPAALFECFWKHLLAETFHDDLPESMWLGGGNRSVEIMRRILDQPQSPWWDIKSTTAVEAEGEVLIRAFVGAVQEMEVLQGADPSRWRWGKMHTVTFRNETLGNSGNKMVENTFNRGPFETSGGSALVNATSWNALRNYQVQDLPSMRMIVDLGNLENSLAIHTTGQSGHAYHPNYIDMADLWRKIQYRPMYFGAKEVEAASRNILTLNP